MLRIPLLRQAATPEEARQYVADLCRANTDYYVDDERGRGNVGELQHIFQKWHYVAELLQNALDEGAQRIHLTAEEDQLMFEHDGNPFEARHVFGLCNKGLSAKGAGTVGFMGLGFKSVFHRYERASVASGMWRFYLEVPLQREERYNDPHLDWTGCFLPRWSDEIEAPTHGMRCRFTFTGRRGGAIADDLRQVLGEEADLLALLAWRGVRELWWADRQWTLASDPPDPDAAERRLIITAQDQHGAKRTWVLFERRYQPSDDAIRAFLTHRRIRPAPGERDKVYAEAARPRHVALFCWLDDGHPKSVGRRGRVYAMLPTNVTTPLGMHLQADWLLNTSREELIHRDNNAWHEAIRDQIPPLLRAVVAWTAELGRQGVAGWERGYDALPEASAASNRDDAWLVGPEFEALLRAELQSLPAFPLPPEPDKPAEFIAPDQTRLLPSPLVALFGDDPAAQRRLFGARALSTPLLGERALKCLRRLRLLTQLQPDEVAEHWRDGTAVTAWLHATPPKQRHALLVELLEALAKLDDDEDWRAAPLVCLPAEDGGRTSREDLRRFPKQWDIVRADKRVHQALRPCAGPLDRLLEWRFDAFLTRNQRGLAYIQDCPVPELKTVTDRWWKTLHEHPPEEEADLVMHFTNWVRKKLPKVRGLVHKVLARFPKKRKQLLDGDEVLLADPYASEHRRALFEDMPAVIREYLDVDAEADPADWRAFFGSLALTCWPQGDVLRVTSQVVSRNELQERVGENQVLPYLTRAKRLSWMAWHPQCFRVHDWEVPNRLWRRLNAQSPSRELLIAFSHALNDETRDYLASRARPRIQYYVEEKKNDHESKTLQCSARWLLQLTDLRWVFAGESGPFRPCEVLSPGSPPEQGALIATLPAGLVEKLPRLEFRKPLADASAAERLRILGPTTDDPARLAALLDEAREEGSRSDAARRELLAVLGEVELFAARDGTRRRYARLVGPKQTAVPRATDLGGFLLWTDDLGGPVADALERMEGWDDTLRIPQVASSSQILAFLHDAWQRGRDVPERAADEAKSRIIAQAYRYVVEDLEAEAAEGEYDLRQEWAQAREEAWVFAESRWVSVESAVLDDLGDPDLCARMPESHWATPAYLGRSPDEQHRTAWWLDLRLLSDEVERTPLIGQPVEGGVVPGRRERFARLVTVLERLQEREKQPSGSSGGAGSSLELRVVRSLAVQTRWLDGSLDPVTAAVSAYLSEGRPPAPSILYIAGDPADFSLVAFDLLLRRYSGLRGGASLAGRISWLLANVDEAARFERILATVCAAHNVELPAGPPPSAGPAEPEEDGTPDGADKGHEERTRRKVGPSGGAPGAGDRSPGSDDGDGREGGGRETDSRRRGARSGSVAGVGTDPESPPSPHERRDDVRGRDAVRQYEIDHGREPGPPLDPLNEGYDLTSKDPATGITRRIEVKGIGDWDAWAVSVTSAQFRHGFREADPGVEYWLYVVDDVNSGRPHVFAIRKAVQRIERFYFRADFWRERADEHGEVGLPLAPDSPGMNEPAQTP
jgi:hypothetical protein